MFQKRLIWQLYPSYLLITLFALFAVTWFSTNALHNLYIDTLVADLQTRADVIAHQIQQNRIPLTDHAIHELCQSLGKVMKCRITVILPSGDVVGESSEKPESMENHRNRPEIQQAFEGKVGHQIRYSHTVFTNMMYIAVPLMNENHEVVAVIRTSIAANAIHTTLREVYFHIFWGGLAVAVLAAGVCFWVSHGISRPLRYLKEGADRFARGNLKIHLDVPESEEVGHVAEAMNKMAEQLDLRIRTINRQRKQQEAIFASMVEGVLAVDKDKRLISMNQAACRLLNVYTDTVEGKRVSEIIDDPDVYRLIDNALSSQEAFEGEIVLGEKEKKYLQAHGAALYDSDGGQVGSVIVFHDITRLRRLENIRRDFVANVSHELKTPITSIKGFVETLMDGAIHDPEDAMRFLGIIAKQAERLHSIIEDLLSLSRIEVDKDKESIPLEPHSIQKLLTNVLECCRPSAEEKNITIHTVCEKDFLIPVNIPLMEQAIVNLIDNAVKYSDPGSKIRLEVHQTPTQVTIDVQDWGCGIEEEHLPRLFERFYRVDKARSRKLGGTGLGLSIVKHITQAHGGYVSVKSEVGEGSIFTIHLPLDSRIG